MTVFVPAVYFAEEKTRRAKQAPAMRVGQKRPRIRDKYTWDEQQHVIGEGTYGIVYRATPKNAPNRSVAIKKFKNTKEGEGISLTACREITVLETSTHYPAYSSLASSRIATRERRPSGRYFS